MAVNQRVGVLIVDHDADFRRLARGLLERRGYPILGEAGSCSSGLALAWSLRPDALLVDVRLPDGSGFMVAEILGALTPPPPVLLMSAAPAPDDFELAEMSGASGLVDKTDLAGVDLTRFWPA